MNKDFRDGENKAYATLAQYLWDSGDLPSFDSPEGVLRTFLEPDRVDEVLECFFKPIDPPSEDGWYLVKVETPSGQEERKLYYCRRHARGCDPWWKGFLQYGDTPVKHEIGVKDGEKVLGYRKVSSGDRVNSEGYIDRWIKDPQNPSKYGIYLTLFYDHGVADFNVYEYGLGTQGVGWYDYNGELTNSVNFWRPLPQLPEGQ